jgi:hypothetical protein
MKEGTTTLYANDNPSSSFFMNNNFIERKGQSPRTKKFRK